MNDSSRRGMEETARKRIIESIEVKEKTIENLLPKIAEATDTIIKCYKKGGQVILFGNGGSAADAQHIEAELVNMLYKNRPMLNARSLTTNTSVMTSIGNDRSFDDLFARQIEHLGKRRDVIIGLSTSGNSENVIRGIKKAKEKGAFTIGMTGLTGGKMKNMCNILLNIPSEDVARIQEAHITIGHIICEIIENNYFKKYQVPLRSSKNKIISKVSIVITAFREPMIYRAMEVILFQKISREYELVVISPDKEVEELVKSYQKNYPQIRYFKDEGKGKSKAINDVLPTLSGELIIMTDGDVFIDNEAINEMVKVFEDPETGCACGRILCENPRYSKFGYWGKLLADVGANKVRKMLSTKNKFLECSGYLFGFRNNKVIKDIPLDVAEDSIIPYYFWKEGYKIRYVENARVFVKNPTNIKDWLKQRKRTAKAHTNLTRYAPDFPKVKSFRNEAGKGMKWVWSYPKNVKEFAWTIELIFVRLYMWANVYFDEYVIKKSYTDGWERVASTKL